MKTIISISLSICMLFTFELHAQDSLLVDTASYSYYTGNQQIIKNYIITNNSNEEYFTWVSRVPIKDKSNGQLVRDFFIKQNGDFTYLSLMYEDLPNLIIGIGSTFITKISPHETFSYFIAKKDSNTTYYEDRIVIIKKKEVEKYIRLPIEEQYFFKQKSIVLIGESRINNGFLQSQ